MSFTFLRRSDVTEVVAAITDPDLRISSRSAADGPVRVFRPTMVRLTLSRFTPDTHAPAVQVHVTGPSIRPNGSPGAQVLGVTFSGPSQFRLHKTLDEMPSWLASWVQVFAAPELAS